MTQHRLDWRPAAAPDPRRALHRVQRKATARTARNWRIRMILDQGMEGSCVGHGTTGAITASPIRVALPYPQQTAFGMYRGALRIDEFPGEADEGTSVDAGMRLLRELGLISAWEWCHDPDTLRYTVLEEGTVVVGMWIPAGFEEPDEQGLVDMVGPIIGGHCLYITGYWANRKFRRYEGPVYQLANSWGPEWGRKGFLYLREADVAAQFHQEGEFAIPRR